VTGDSVDAIARLSRGAETIALAPDHAKTGRYFLRLEDGSYEERFAAVLPSARTFLDIPSIANEALRDAEEHGATHVLAFVGSERVTIETDDDAYGAFRQHHLRLPLHPVYTAVRELLATRTFDQRNLVRYLRATLNENVPDEVVEEFRLLRLTANENGESEVGKSRVAVDRQMVRAVRVRNGSDVPPTITANVPVFDVPGAREVRYPVTILVEAVPSEDGGFVFELTAILNDVRNAEHFARSWVRDALRDQLGESGVTVLLGDVANR